MKSAQKSNIKLFLSAAVVGVSGCLGVGFVSGAEAKVFFADRRALLVFCVTYAASLFVFRVYASRCGAQTSTELVHSLPKKFGAVACRVLTICGLMTCIAVCSGAAECLDYLFGTNLSVLHCVPICLAVCFVGGKNGGVKIVSAVAVFACLVWLVVCFVASRLSGCADIFQNFAQTVAKLEVVPANNRPFGAFVSTFYRIFVLPTAYALFSAVTSLSVQCKTCNGYFSVAKNAAVSLISAALTAFCVFVVCITANFAQNLPLLALSNGTVFKLVAVVCVEACAVSCVSSNVIGVCEMLLPLVSDKTLRNLLIFLTILLLSPFRFDKVMTAVYFFVAFVGIVLLLFLAKSLTTKSAFTSKIR